MKKIEKIKKSLKKSIDEYISECTMPIIDLSLQRTWDIKEDVENLEKRIERIEKKIRWYWNIFLFLGIISFLYLIIH